MHPQNTHSPCQRIIIIYSGICFYKDVGFLVWPHPIFFKNSLYTRLYQKYLRFLFKSTKNQRKSLGNFCRFSETYIIYLFRLKSLSFQKHIPIGRQKMYYILYCHECYSKIFIPTLKPFPMNSSRKPFWHEFFKWKPFWFIFIVKPFSINFYNKTLSYTFLYEIPFKYISIIELSSVHFYSKTLSRVF